MDNGQFYGLAVVICAIFYLIYEENSKIVKLSNQIDELHTELEKLKKKIGLK